VEKVDLNRSWYVLHIGHPSNVDKIRPMFGRKNYKLWIPTFKIKTSLWSKGRIRDKWAFPGYAYICVTEENIDYTFVFRVEDRFPGVYFLKYGDTLCKLQKSEIERVYEKVVERSKTTMVAPEFSIGSNVMIWNGALANLVGKIVEIQKERVVLEIILLGRSVTVQVDVADVVRL